jgi:hypothetical protein
LAARGIRFANVWQKSSNFAEHWQIDLQAQAVARVAEPPQSNGSNDPTLG